MLDATDRALIALLRENARIGHAEAARRLKLSRTTVQAHVTIVVAPKASGGVVSALQRMPELRALHSVAGVFDLLAVVEAQDVPSLDAAIDKIGALDGVERTQ